MVVRDIMSRDVELVTADEPVTQAAKRMAERDVGVLPVGEDDRLVGIITDRDLALRATVDGKSSDTVVRDVMSIPVKYVYEDEAIDEAARNMAELQIRRLPVVNREKRLVGIVSLGDLAAKEAGSAAQLAIREVSRPAR